MNVRVEMKEPVKASSAWIWFPGDGAFGILRKKLARPRDGGNLTLQCAAFDRYELYLDGRLALEGSLPGDLPRWIPIDAVSISLSPSDQPLLVEVLVYHSRLERIHYRGESRPGFWAMLTLDGDQYTTDSTWQAAGLEAWKRAAPRMNHVLDPLEDVDITGAQWRWREQGCVLDIDDDFSWQDAQVVDLPDPLRSEVGWEHKAGFVSRSLCPARHYWLGWAGEDAVPAFTATAQANAGGALDPSPQTGPLCERVIDPFRHDLCVVDFGEAVTGMPCVEIDTPVSLMVELGWAERLSSEGLPVIYGKGTLYQARYRVPPGRHELKPFHWSGFRYLRVGIEAQPEGTASIRLSACAIRRALSLPAVRPTHSGGTAVAKIEVLCRTTLEKTLPEYPADCPTREKAHYWTDGLFISLALERIYGEAVFADWYCEAFRRVPMQVGGLFSSVYPGDHRVLVDACLAPVIGWRYRRALRGEFTVDTGLWAKALRVNAWYEKHVSGSGLLEVPGWEPDAGELVFLDHPGLPWHHFAHPSLDRRNPSAALNLYYLAFLQSLLQAAAERDGELEEVLADRTAALSQAIRETFWDGAVLRDSDFRRYPDAGVSWLANSLGVVGGVLRGEEAVNAMRTMMESYDTVCRCTPGTIFWFLQAASLTKLFGETEQILGRLFGKMLKAQATATWETFDGELEDSLCHPWLAAPVAMYLADPEGFGCSPPLLACVASKGRTG